MELLLCVLLLLTVVRVTAGVYYPHHYADNEARRPQVQQVKSSPKLRQSSQPLEALFSQHSRLHNPAGEASGGEPGNQPEDGTVGKEKSPRPPAAIGNLFSSLDMVETPGVGRHNNAGVPSPVGLWEGGTMVGPNSEGLGSEQQGHKGDTMSLLLGNQIVRQPALVAAKPSTSSHGRPSMFTTQILSSKPLHKIRRNRDRNHHRKAIQRHAGANDKHVKNNMDAQTLIKVQPSVTANTIVNQHLKFLSKYTWSQMAHMNSNGPGVAGQKSVLAHLKAIHSLTSPGKDVTSLDAINGQIVRTMLGSVKQQRRRKRSAILAGHLSHDALPGETFYYRQPDGHSGSVSRPHDNSGANPDPLVHSLEIEEVELSTGTGDEGNNKEDVDTLPSPSESIPSDKQTTIKVETRPAKQVSHDDNEKGPEEPVRKEIAAGSSPSMQEQPSRDQPSLEDRNVKKLDDIGIFPSGSLFDNTTVNETLARQMYRSPMLVDYGSRAKPQDVLQPTESDMDEEALAETKVDDMDTSWTEAEGTDDDILALQAEDPIEEDKISSQLPEAESDTKEEPVEEQPVQTMEVPVTLPPMEVPLNIPIPTEPAPGSEFAVEGEVPEPGAESEPETEPEPEPELLPVGEGEASGESESESKPESEQDGSAAEESGYSYAEPQPEWEEAKKMWGPWWEIHVYGIGLGFAILSIYSFVSIVRLWRKKNLLSQGYFIALNIIMFIIGTFRALYFLIDGYNSNGTFSKAGHYFLYSIGFPCLTSAFSILLLALLQTLKMQILSPRVQRTGVLVGIIAAHFLLSITTDIIVGYLLNTQIMMLVCQVLTVIWGLILFIGYIYVFRKLYKAAMWRQNEMMRLSLAKFKLDGIAPITKAPRLTLNMAVKITLSTAIFGLMLAGLQTYGLVGINSIFSKDVPNPWTWLAFNTGMRIIELAMCITMSYVATQPFRYHRGGKGGDMPQSWSSCISGFIYMAPCRRIFECDSVSLHDDELSWNDLPVTTQTGQLDSNGAPVISEEATPMTANGRAAHAAAAAVVHNHNEQQGSCGSNRSSKVGVAARPASLLVSDNGFIRFREDGEMGGSPVLLSTDDELENISGDNMIRNPFYRDLLRRQEKERAVGRATFVNSDGITLQDEFGLVDSVPDPELVPPPRPAYPVMSSCRGCSYPNTGTNTPGTPRSFCSTDLDYAASEGSYRPPSSIHLRDSIENALNIPGFTLRTPDILDSPLNAAYLRTRRGSLFGSRIGARPLGTGSMSDLESLRHYGPGSRYGESEDTMDQLHNDRAASPDSMYSCTLSNLTRAPLVRSYSDSIGKASQPEVSYPNSPERRYYKDRLRASMLRNLPENANQFQNLLKNINEMCNVYNKLSPDDREGDE